MFYTSPPHSLLSPLLSFSPVLFFLLSFLSLSAFSPLLLPFPLICSSAPPLSLSCPFLFPLSSFVPILLLFDSLYSLLPFSPPLSSHYPLPSSSPLLILSFSALSSLIFPHLLLSSSPPVLLYFSPPRVCVLWGFLCFYTSFSSFWKDVRLRFSLTLMNSGAGSFCCSSCSCLSNCKNTEKYERFQSGLFARVFSLSGLEGLSLVRPEGLV